ncbi:hypothetical protein CVT24_002210 [Panaeolus cyanescens]|uniref:Uncharacterized protein n=1 Tax=Panaeolus cyanescens TaxID=181874 RepID=A0A409X034_9AGAR|nr:hypothetical protein CVT24_002210 [Panaeolus cyanescens]
MSHNFIDDQDLTRVKYTGRWIRGGGPSEHHGTVASSTIEGDYFTVSFYGSIISVFGTIDATSGGVVTNYSVDGAPPAQVTSQAGGGDTYDQQFWRSGWLNVGDHELKVTMIKINPDPIPGEGTIWFDYFKSTDPTIRPPSDSTVRRRHVGEIAGGVIGGFIFLALVLAIWVVLKRQRQKGRVSKDGLERLPDGEKQLSSLSRDHEGRNKNMSGGAS